MAVDVRFDFPRGDREEWTMRAVPRKGERVYFGSACGPTAGTDQVRWIVADVYWSVGVERLPYAVVVLDRDGLHGEPPSQRESSEL